MALPSSRRPAYAQQLLEEESKKVQTKISKFKINVADTVISCVGKWYKSLSTKSKEVLTRKQFKRRVLKYCFDFNLNYQNLPATWVSTLEKKYGLKLKEKKKKNSKLPNKIKFSDYVEDGLEDAEEDEMDGLVLNGSKKTFKEDLRHLMNKSNFKLTITNNTPGKSTDSSFEDGVQDRRASLRKRNSDEPVPNDNQNIEGQIVSNTKRLIDLTDEPPPLKWLAACSKVEGVHVPPRILRIHSTDEENILFYDYEQTEIECPPGTMNKFWKHNFDWWNDKIIMEDGMGNIKPRCPTKVF